MPLTPQQIQRKQALIVKLGARTLSVSEAYELKSYLEIERQDMIAAQNTAAAMAILAILAVLTAFLIAASKES
jgi:hypothetical protein